jgi:large subunit ribosomal protein L32e
MADDKKRLIRARNAQRGSFKRQGLSRKKKLEDTWRRPRGLQSKQRKGFRAKGAHPQPGYGSPKAVRGMHPSGFEDVLVFNIADMENLNPEIQAVRIASTVGNRKRTEIQAKAEELGFRILNLKEVPSPSEKKEAKVKKEAEEETVEETETEEEEVAEETEPEEEEVVEETETEGEEVAEETEAAEKKEVKGDE